MMSFLKSLRSDITWLEDRKVITTMMTTTHIMLDLLSHICGLGESCTIVGCIALQPASLQCIRYSISNILYNVFIDIFVNLKPVG